MRMPAQARWQEARSSVGSGSAGNDTGPGRSGVFLVKDCERDAETVDCVRQRQNDFQQNWEIIYSELCLCTWQQNSEQWHNEAEGFVREAGEDCEADIWRDQRGGPAKKQQQGWALLLEHHRVSISPGTSAYQENDPI